MINGELLQSRILIQIIFFKKKEKKRNWGGEENNVTFEVCFVSAVSVFLKMLIALIGEIPRLVWLFPVWSLLRDRDNLDITPEIPRDSSATGFDRNVDAISWAAFFTRFLNFFASSSSCFRLLYSSRISRRFCFKYLVSIISLENLKNFHIS